MRKKMLIDGYNIIHAHSEWKKQDVELARENLIREAINLSSVFEGLIIIVFDGSNSNDYSDNTEERAGVRLVYTRKGEKADSYIEQMVHEDDGSLIYVVTADYNQQRVVFSKGALRKTPVEFFREIKNSQMKLKEYEQEKTVKKIFLEDLLDKETLNKIKKLTE